MNENDKPHPFETPHILHDWPLVDAKDEAQFKFKEYAVTLARLIADKKTGTPFTLGISGAWGAGKTTLLRRIQVMLDETRTLLDSQKAARLSFVNPQENPADYRVCRTVWFNAWKYADEGQLMVALVRVIVQEMFKDDFISKGAAALLEPFTPRRDVIDTVLGWFSIKTPFVEVNPNMGKAEKTPFAERTAMLDLFDDAFDKLVAAWVHHSMDKDKIDPAQGVLVVFIDDLDRCLPAKMVQVLEAVKLFMDKRGCVFVLGADKEIIQQAVEKQYADAGVRGQTASDYLEKVIQLRFNIPPVPDEEMDSFVKSQVKENVLNTHWRIVALGAESNPRKVKTFLNDLMLQWSIWKNTDQAGGVNFDDFVRWEVLMRSAPAFRKRIYGIYDPEMRARLLGFAFAWALGNEEAAASFRPDLNEQIQRVLKDIEPHKAHFTPGLIKKLIYLVAAPPVEGEAAGAPKAKEGEPAEAIRKERELDIKGKPEKKRIDEAGGKEAQPEGSVPARYKIFEFGGIEFVKIPKGEFIMGSTKKNKLAFDDERPQFKHSIPDDYWMGRYPVTNAQYAAYAGKDFKVPRGKENHPVVNVTWHDAQKFIAWLNETRAEKLPTGFKYSLPSEAEWEKAARGEFGNEWPWGNEFDPARCNTDEGKKGKPTQVGNYSPQGDSPYGCTDMAGNVWEWTRSLWGKLGGKPDYGYPYDPKDGRELLQAGDDVARVLRGGSFSDDQWSARCAYRYRSSPYVMFDYRGFRVVVVSPS